MAVDLSQYKIVKQVLDIRYPTAFLLWDRAGHIWDEVSKQFPNVKLKSAQPNQTSVAITDAMDGVVNNDKAVLIQDVEDSAKQPAFIEAAAIFFPLVIHLLEVQTLKRVGMRIHFEREFQSSAAASEYFLGATNSSVAEGKFFNFEGRALDFERHVRIESDSLGISIKHLTQKQTVNLELPAAAKALLKLSDEQVTPRERNVVLLDVDYYAHSPMPVGSFHVKRILESWTHAIRRDIARFLNASRI